MPEFFFGCRLERFCCGSAPTPMRRLLSGEELRAGKSNFDERMLAGVGCGVRRPNYGEAAVAGGDHLLEGFPPAEGLLPGGNRQLR